MGARPAARAVPRRTTTVQPSICITLARPPCTGRPQSSDHVPALYQMNTGIARVGLPTAGAWVTYGLGSENRNLPGFVVLGGNKGIKGGPLHWSAGFLPAAYQGTLFRAQGSPILNL